VPRSVIVVPCFNEARRFSADAFREFARGWPDGAFILIDDGSRDDTFRVLSTLQQAMPQCFEVLRMPENVGKAEATRRGILRALGAATDHVGFWDADLATPLEALPQFEAVFQQRPSTEIVFGARVKLLGRDIQRKPVRHYLGRCFATAVSTALGIGVYDTQCGAKLFRVSDTIREVFAEPFCSRWIFDVEILARFIRRREMAADADLGAFVYELPLTAWHDIRGSKLRTTDFLRAGVDLWRIYRSQA
jgi:dolichyl-phosphate beta-glucosyltransferase